MNKLRNVTGIFAGFFGILGTVLFGVSNAFALDWTGITMDLSDVNAYYALAIPALIALWGLRKVVKGTNRT